MFQGKCFHPLKNIAISTTLHVGCYEILFEMEIFQKTDRSFTKVWKRKCVFIGRLNDTWVMVTNEERPNVNNHNICNEIRNGELPVVTILCNYSNRNPAYIRGRYVMIQKKNVASVRYIMHFCEVVVLSCPPGWWGISLPGTSDCSQTCSNCNEVETCGVSDGHCKDGWWGGDCNRQCNCVTQTACGRLDGTFAGDEILHL